MAFGGFGQRGANQPMAEINTTPLVDVMLVLLVIFIITAPLLTHSIRLDLPDAPAPVAAQAPGTVTISIDAGGAIYWNGALVPGVAELDRRLRDVAAAAAPPEVQLRADRETRYQRIAEVMSSAQRAGIARIGFVTDPGAAAR